jgi:hypothetical protein
VSAEDSVAALIPLVTAMSGHIVEIKGDLGDVKAEVAEVKATGAATLAQATRTNGRMTTAEDRLDAHATALALIAKGDELHQIEAAEHKDQVHNRRLYRLAAAGALCTLLGGVAGDLGRHFGWW